MTTGAGPERDEQELRALFDRTAETPDRVQLVKLTARARDVPNAGQRRSRHHVWGAIFAVAAGALAVFAARGVFEHGRVEQPVATVSVSESPRPPETAVAQTSAKPPDEIVSPEEAAALADDSDLASDESVELGSLGDDTASEDPLAALDTPADDDVDTWMNATEAYLGGG